MPEQPFLSVVIPARNEAENVRPLVSEVRQALDGAFEYELIYVDDGSTDATFETLKALAAEGFDRLRALRHERSTGQSFAVLTGARAARGGVGQPHVGAAGCGLLRFTLDRARRDESRALQVRSGCHSGFPLLVAVRLPFVGGSARIGMHTDGHCAP